MTDPVELSPVDLGILRNLQDDARISNKELAAAVGIAPSTCLDRVARLRATGVITGQHAHVDAAKLAGRLRRSCSSRFALTAARWSTRSSSICSPNRKYGPSTT
jgi:DNA-binding Lrp family transcriptional regulator